MQACKYSPQDQVMKLTLDILVLKMKSRQKLHTIYSDFKFT